MIKAIIFDLDGTLIQTEILKAKSYARAITFLTKKAVHEKKVMEGFKKYVGLSRQEVAKGLVEDFQLELGNVYPCHHAESLQELVLSKRLEIYSVMIGDPKLLSKFFCPFSHRLLQSVHHDQYLTALATMSNIEEVNKVLDVMKIRQQLHVVVTRDKVKNGKPDPEIYLAVKDRFKIQPQECLVIEDSVNGIQAGLNAGMHVFAVTNNVTRESVHAANLLDEKYIVDELTELNQRVYQFLNELNIN